MPPDLRSLHLELAKDTTQHFLQGKMGAEWVLRSVGTMEKKNNQCHCLKPYLLPSVAGTLEEERWRIIEKTVSGRTVSVCSCPSPQPQVNGWRWRCL